MRLAVLTTGRQDWGLLRPLCEALRDAPDFDLKVIAGGMACSPAFGRIVDQIRVNGFEVAAELDWSPESEDALVQTGRALMLVGDALRSNIPDALILLGDRYETVAVALAATLLKIPLVHLYGGEETEGAFDNAFRHAITKMSHLHLVAHEAYARRVLQMGEDISSVHVVGSLGVDNIKKRKLPSKLELESDLKIPLIPPVGLVTVHPTTLSREGKIDEIQAIIGAMDRYPATWIVTLPNADPGNEAIRQAFLDMAARNRKVFVVSALGEERYLGLMALSAFALGNSSSGITEAPSLKVPTINVGDRQKGRIRSASVLDVPCDTDAILAAILKAESEDFGNMISGQSSIFGDGDAAEKIIAVLRAWIPPNPPLKPFRSIEVCPLEK